MPECGDQPLNAIGTKAGETICFCYSQSIESSRENVRLPNMMLNLKLSHFKRLVNVSYILFMASKW